MMKKIFCIILFLVIPIFYIFSQTQNASASDDFVLVQGGSFFMGSEAGDEDEKPAHKVAVDNFYICKHEVTQKDWLNVMENNPSFYKGEKRPVEQISWYDAIEYCNLLSKKDGLEPCYKKEGKNYICDFTKNGYRLPTEAEWEYAAGGGLKRKDNKYSGGNQLDNFAWYENNSNNSQTVMTLQPNELGLYDMSGNVWEWCWDKYGNYNKNTQINPSGATSGSERVIRGGRWRSHDSDCRVTNRSSHSPKESYYGIGFRVARTAGDVIVVDTVETAETEKTFLNDEAILETNPATEFSFENNEQKVAVSNTDKNEKTTSKIEPIDLSSDSETEENKNNELHVILGSLTGGIMIGNDSAHTITPCFGFWGVPFSCMVLSESWGIYTTLVENINFSIHTPFSVYGEIGENTFIPGDNLDDSYEYYFEPDGSVALPFYMETISLGLCRKIFKYTWLSFGGGLILTYRDMHGNLYYRQKNSTDDFDYYGEGYAREYNHNEATGQQFKFHPSFTVQAGINVIYKHLYTGVWYKYISEFGHQIDMRLGFSLKI